MIERDRLRELHGVDLPLHILEQDYVQALFLTELYRETEDLVFKGGTFLKHAHGLDRFSEDLDFTAYGATSVPAQLEDAAEGLARYGLQAELDRIGEQSDGVVGRLRYRGPLYDGTERSRGSVEIDVSTRDDVVRDPDWLRLFFPYPETRAVTARCLVIEEAMAEKLRALSTRSRGRDLYDIWFLAEQGVPIDAALFERKMAAVGESPLVSLSITERKWNRDLSVLVERPPSYPTVRDAVEAAVEAAGLAFRDEATSDG